MVLLKRIWRWVWGHKKVPPTPKTPRCYRCGNRFSEWFTWGGWMFCWPCHEDRGFPHDPKDVIFEPDYYR